MRLTALLSLAATVYAAANLTPDYEVKALLDPSAVLGSDNKLKPAVLSTFGMPSSVTKMNVQFLDTDAKEIYGAGWSPRIRKTEGEKSFELTYKKRYPISGGASGIDAALNLANIEGFDATDDNYEAQVEWGYTKLTLSLSRKKSASASGYSGMDLPGKSASRDMLIDNAPGKFDNWKSKAWGTNLLKNARVYGPVLAKRSIGTWNGTKLYIEVWPIKTADGSGIEYVVEASFKTDSDVDAAQKHDELIAFLTSKAWFLAQDSLKTQLMMDRY